MGLFGPSKFNLNKDGELSAKESAAAVSKAAKLFESTLKYDLDGGANSKFRMSLPKEHKNSNYITIDLTYEEGRKSHPVIGRITIDKYSGDYRVERFTDEKTGHIQRNGEEVQRTDGFGKNWAPAVAKEPAHGTASAHHETNPSGGGIGAFFKRLFGGGDKAEHEHQGGNKLSHAADSKNQHVIHGNIDNVAIVANRYLGVKEEGKNSGAAIRQFGAPGGQAWCGYFAKHVFDHSVPGVYTQPNYMAAVSFKTHAERYGAFHESASSYTPHVGDAAVFTRKGGHHVGIVSDVNGRTATYIAGNQNDAVESSRFSLDSPPSSLLGFSSTQQIAAAKGIHFNNHKSHNHAQNTQLAYSNVQAHEPPGHTPQQLNRATHHRG